MKTLMGLLFAGFCSAAVCADFDLATQCLDCHRPGQTRGEVPLIEGQHRDYLRHQLGRFRDRHRLSFPMSGLTAGMDDARVDSIAQSLSDRAWPDDAIPLDPQAIGRGRKQAARFGCDACHGEGFLGGGDIPRIAGQQPGYLARQIGAFGLGHRYHPPTGTGSPMRAVTPEQAGDLGAFLHSLGHGVRKRARDD